MKPDRSTISIESAQSYSAAGAHEMRPGPGAVFTTHLLSLHPAGQSSASHAGGCVDRHDTSYPGTWWSTNLVRLAIDSGKKYHRFRLWPDGPMMPVGRSGSKSSMWNMPRLCPSSCARVNGFTFSIHAYPRRLHTPGTYAVPIESVLPNPVNSTTMSRPTSRCPSCAYTDRRLSTMEAPRPRVLNGSFASLQCPSTPTSTRRTHVARYGSPAMSTAACNTAIAADASLPNSAQNVLSNAATSST